MSRPRDRLLVIACGALAKEMLEVVSLNSLDWVDVECLPARLHNTPELIPAAVAERLDSAVGRYREVFVGYADCGTGGMLDKVLEARESSGFPAPTATSSSRRVAFSPPCTTGSPAPST